MGWPVLFLIASKLVFPSQVGFSHECNWWVTSLFILIHELFLLFPSPSEVGGVRAGQWAPGSQPRVTPLQQCWGCAQTSTLQLCSCEFSPVHVPWSSQWWQHEQIQQLGCAVIALTWSCLPALPEQWLQQSGTQRAVMWSTSPGNPGLHGWVTPPVFSFLLS